jgi:glutamate-1-semialdehyde 2,1-aminomutase
MQRKVSEQLFSEAKKYFPGGVSSPVRAFKSVGGTPLFIKKGDGAFVWDEDDNRFTDFCASWGPLILGHNNEIIREAIIEAVSNGTSFGTPTKYENKLGKLLLDNNRFIEKIRFVSSGTEAVMSAIRLARGVTGKSKVLKFEGCYHGHVDSLLVKAGSGLVTFGVSTSAGIPEAFAKETIVLPLNNLESVENLFMENSHDIACVIIEPVPANNGLLLQTAEYLQGLKDLCIRFNILLIFDEVISGFRVGFEGAAGYYGIQPDIVTYGKIIGGGMPVGAYAADTAIMGNVAPEGTVYQAGTLSGNPVAMAAGFAAASQLIQAGFYCDMANKTRKFVTQLQNYADNKGYEVTFPSIGSIFWIAFTRDTIREADQIDPKSMDKFKIMHADLLERGIYLGPSGYEVGFISAAHNDEILEESVDKICKSLDVVHA